MAFIYEGMNVKRVVDGDTIVVYGEIEPGRYAYQTVRLLGVNSPEKKGATKQAGLEAQAFTSSHLLDRLITLRVYKKDDFGRWIADVFIDASVKIDGEFFNQELLEAHQAVVYKDR